MAERTGVCVGGGGVEGWTGWGEGGGQGEIKRSSTLLMVGWTRNDIK